MPDGCKQHQHCIKTALKQAEDICSKAGSRLTTIRKRILELIWEDHGPVKAYDLLTKFQQEDPAAKPSTIYRALDFLFAHALVHKIHRLNAYVGCSSPDKDCPSFFLICTNCHNVTESHDVEYRDILSNISKTHAFKTTDATLEIEGLCRQCV